MVTRLHGIALAVILAAVIAAAAVVPGALAAVRSGEAIASDLVAGAVVEGPAAHTLAQMAAAPADQKLDAHLKQLAHSDPERSVRVVVMSTDPIRPPFRARVVHEWSWPAGERLAVLKLRAADLPDLAGLPGIIGVTSAQTQRAGGIPPSAPTRDASVAAGIDPVALGLRARLAPPWASASSTVGGAGAVTPHGRTDPGRSGTEGWFDADAGHAAVEAWQMGYRGAGVRVAVLDYAVDFAHPDLQGTWAILPEGHPDAGWPQVFDPQAGFEAVLDKDRSVEALSSRTATTGRIELYQTSPVSATFAGHTGVYTACLRPLLYKSDTEPAVLGSLDCGFVVPGTAEGGTVRFGHHPDTTLRDLAATVGAGAAGELVGVLGVDETTAGVIDTVYVDVDGDHDFTDEKPVTKQSPLSWRDIDGDGLADLSGGLLYYVSDGQRPFPGSWLWGLESDLPAAGEIVGIHYVTGDHGTLCASNIVSQGVLGVPKDRRIAFRDLPGDGQPPSLNLGMAPDAELVSVGNVYSGGGPIFSASWRYAVLGPDPGRSDDDIQIASNSYGWSGTDNDGWDADSRLVDYYVRTFAPQTSFLMATGNGGFGYGTNAPPSPVVAMGVAASTQIGSASGESITDTAQITFGDITSFSNRGPTADGRTGVSVAANGDFGTGAEPVNYVGSGAESLVNWSGTSRSTPVAAGVMALVYDAFRAKTGRWPTWQEAQSIMMSGARYAGYDTLTMGAGVVDAADSVRIAAGQHGIYAMPSEWTPGGYRGTAYPAFAKLMSVGETASTTITLTNASDHDIEVSLSARTPRLIGSHELAIDTNLAEESPPSPIADYLLPIPRSAVPIGTELMVVRGAFPLRQFDVDADYDMDNRFDLGVLQHTDLDGDGALWTDLNGNGVVNHRYLLDSFVDATWSDGGLQAESIHGSVTPPLPEGGLVGDLAWFGRGCSGDAPAQAVDGKVALIQRGTCTFVEKILHAQDEGAVGVVVFTDDRAKQDMPGREPAIYVPGVMIDRQPGMELATLLDAGTAVQVRVVPRHFEAIGLGAVAQVVYAETELDQWEFNRVSRDNDGRNHWAVPVHHPLERWADGLYVGAWHTGRTAAVTNTHIALRLDFYAYQAWPEVTLNRATVTVPAGGQAAFGARYDRQDSAPPSVIQGAIFADYARAEGDSSGSPGTAAGGFELPYLRAVVPVNVNLAESYDWRGAVVLGGVRGRDEAAPYDNGAMWGAFKWDWRPESGDWRFYFLDAVAKPARNTFWLARTEWADPSVAQADIDTAILAPVGSRYSDPADPSNAAEDMSDPEWYGPYTLGLLARSPYLVRNGSVWPFNTTSGANEDWLVAPAGEGLHEILLHNVLSSGAELAMPFTTTVSSVRFSDTAIRLYGDACAKLAIEPQMTLDAFAAESFGMSVPEVITGVVAVADDPNNVAATSFRHDVVLETRTGRFDVTLDGEDDDDLDLYLLYDANADGSFEYDREVIGSSAGGTADERVSLAGFRDAGHYQVWVHGYSVNGEGSTFDLTIDTISGSSLVLRDVPADLPAAQVTEVSVCVDLADLAGEEGPAAGIVVAGPKGAPSLFQLPVTWSRQLPTVYLPSLGVDARSP